MHRSILRPAIVVTVAAGLLGACHGGSSSGRSADSTIAATPRSPAAATTTTVVPLGPAILLTAQGSRLDAYATTRPYVTQTVVPSPDADANGVDVSGQICFDPTDRNRFVAVDRTAAADGQVGWGVFELSGTSLGKLSATETARLVPSYQPSSDAPAPFGCGFLPDGRLLTTDLGNQAHGSPDGQLVEWFPPFDRDTVASCKVEVALAEPQGVLVDGDHVYVAESRGRGVASFLSATLPTSARARDGCARRDPIHSPLAFGVVHTELLEHASEHGLANASAIANARDGHLYVASARTGVIAEVTTSGRFVRTVLAPPAPAKLGKQPLVTGSPTGLAVGPDGTLYYADPGLELHGSVTVAGVRAGTVRRITFVHGVPRAPEVIDSGLESPLGVGIWIPTSS